jgi:hypothetical protein
MIKFENTEVMGWGHAIRGMRNPMNSWEKSDSHYHEKRYLSYYDNNPECFYDDEGYAYLNDGICIGPNDMDLMKRLRNAGTDHRKFMRMITVYVDITAPLYWWKEFDTYKVGTVANSCSTMHKIAAKEFTLGDFSCEHLDRDVIPLFEGEVYDIPGTYNCSAYDFMQMTIEALNKYREKYLETKDKKYWWQMIQLLPSSYNQKRTVMMNYEVLANIYKSRRNHKLDEWSEHDVSEEKTPNFVSGAWGFCDWIKTLPYSELITNE